jgi:hypothetical protein
MHATTTATSTLRELAQRRNDGLEVTLLWNVRTEALTVIVDDARSGDHFELGAPSDRALDVFNHPFAYAA